MDLRLAVFCVLIGIQWTLSRSEDCEYSYEASAAIAVCSVVDLNTSLPAIHPNTTHALIKAEYLPKHKINSSLSFKHLTNAKVILLDKTIEYSTRTVYMSASSFSANSSIHRFMSRLHVSVEPDTFRLLHNLQDLTLTATAMKWEFIPQIFNMSLCDKTNLKRISLHRFSTEYGASPLQTHFDVGEVFGQCQMPNLQVLDLSGNDIFRITGNFLKIFPGLRVVDISYNQLMKIGSYVSDAGRVLFINFLLLPQLHTLDIGYQSVLSPPEKPLDQEDLLKSLEVPQSPLKCNVSLNEYWLMKIALAKNPEVLTQNLCVSLVKLVLSGLYLNLNMRSFIRINSGDYWFPQNALTYIDASQNPNVRWKGSEFSIPKRPNHVEFLNIQSTNLKLSNLSFIDDLPSLKVLLLGRNHLGNGLSSANASVYFGNNLHLEVLDLAANDITRLPVSFLENKTRLMELNLTENHISDFHINISALLKLRLINITYNAIRNISSPMRKSFDDLNAQGNLTVDLSNNPLYCGCNDIDFVSWMQSTDVNLHGREDLMCGYPYLGLVTVIKINVDDLRMQCFPSKVMVILTSVLVTIAIVGVLIASVQLYRKRWKLRYWWYVTQKGWRQLTITTDMTSYDYDAFVAYDYRDFSWIKHKLLVEMEEERGFRLCVHHRDFPAGEILEEIIVDRIKKSKKTIMVLTPRFVNSKWCDFEVSMARNQLFDLGRDVIVAVILKPLLPSSINGTLFNVLKKKLYLEWDESDADAQKLFWRKLTDALSMGEA